MNGQKPSVGRAVHFVNIAGKCRAATITDVETDDFVCLTVFAPTATHDGTWARFDAVKKPETWHWPERV